VYTFHPPRHEAQNERIRELQREQQDLRQFRDNADLSVEERERLAELDDEVEALRDQQREGERGWASTTSLVLIILATVAMAVSLVRPERLPVISNGLLLGGVFTMLYGTGWIIASGNSITRFFVMTAALVVTLGLGYVRFVRGRSTAAAPREATSSADPELLRRIEALEHRAREAARALGED
jgi:hypothetical protein